MGEKTVVFSGVLRYTDSKLRPRSPHPERVSGIVACCEASRKRVGSVRNRERGFDG